MKYLISVIVPAYNCENYLCRAVESVISQNNFEAIQLIIVDDGSTDSTGKICDDYSAKFKNIITFHQDNSGVSTARNVGLENAEGEWIAFLDSDDYLLPDAYSQMLDGIDADLICCDYLTDEKKSGEMNCLFKKMYLKKNEFAEYLYPLMSEYALFYNCWNKLYKKEIIEKNNIRFDISKKFGEDMMFLYTYIRFIESFRYVDKPLYFYYVNESSVTKYVDDSFEVYKNIYFWLDNYYSLIPCDTEKYKRFNIETFVYRIVMTINGIGNNVGMFSGIKQIKKILNDDLFFNLYLIENYTEFKNSYDEKLNKYIKGKNPVMLMILMKLNKLKSQAFLLINRIKGKK